MTHSHFFLDPVFPHLTSVLENPLRLIFVSKKGAPYAVQFQTTSTYTLQKLILPLLLPIVVALLAFSLYLAKGVAVWEVHQKIERISGTNKRKGIPFMKP
jgi:hypothetical protein